MINFIKEKLAIRRLKQSLREYTRPDPVFLKSTREKFVIMSQQRSGLGIRARHPLAWKYATIAIVAVLAMTSGVAVFADANNVPVTHPLYNFKRLSERVRLGLSSPDQQIELHRVFAHRRLEEAAELETNHDDHPISSQSQTQIDGLSKDFQHETETGLDQVDNPQVHAESRARFCHDILEVINQRVQVGQLPVSVTDHIKSHCGDAPKNQ